MNQVLQLGLKSFIYYSGKQHINSIVVNPRNLRIGAFVSLRTRGIKSKLISSIIEDKEDKKLKGLMGSAENSYKGFLKENGDESNVVNIQSLRDDPKRIQKMTVQELRTTLRSIGVAAKGCKRDLVSALKGYMDKKIDGESSHIEVEQARSVSFESISVKRKAKNISGQDLVQKIESLSDISVLQRNKKKVKQSPAQNKTVEVDTKIIKTKQKISIKTKEISVNNAVTLPTNQTEPWTVLAHKKPQKGWIPYNPRIMRPPHLDGGSKSMRVISWNVNGLRALLKLEGFSALQLAQREDFDVLCLQETKLQEKDVESIKESLLHGYENSFWTCSVSKLGYSGTAIISRIKPLSVTYGLGMADHDSEGRLVTAEFDSFYLLSAYVPNSGDGLRRLSYRVTNWDPSLSSYMKELEKKKPVILTGDLNCAHQEIDIFNPAGNRRSAGFTDEERQSFGTNFLSQGFVDTFRAQHPGVVGYTYWGYRHHGRKFNKGWRLDYFLVSESIADKVHDSYILPDVAGSDHCPIGLILKL